MFVLAFPLSAIPQAWAIEKNIPSGNDPSLQNFKKEKERNLMPNDYGVVESVLLKKVNIMINNLGLCN